MQMKTTSSHIVLDGSRPGEFGEICREIVGGVFVFEVLFSLGFFRQPTTGLGATKQRHPEKGSTIIRQVSWPQVVLFMSCGSFSVIFCVERKQRITSTKDLPFGIGCR